MPDHNPRVLFLGRSRYLLPLPNWLSKKWDAMEQVIDYRVLGAAEPGGQTRSRRFRLHPPERPRALDGALFYVRLPFRIKRQIDEFDPEAIVAADPFIGAAALVGRRLARVTTPVIVEVHGDSRTFARSYGSPARRLLSPATDRISDYVLRRADATRGLSKFTSGLIEGVRGEPATATFPTYSDLSAFVSEPVKPLPAQPAAIFVGMLEAYKNIDGLADAWRRVVTSVPEARLVIIGKGSRRQVVDDLIRDLPDQVEYHPQLLPDGIVAELDNATVLVLPSWPEGLGRVIIEAFARGRGVIATAAGGVVDLVENGVEGILIARADTDALVAELIRVLSDRDLAARLGEAAHIRYADWHSTAPEFAQKMRALVDLTLDRVPNCECASSS
jgi:glycosyltransferase involved in cell wall biosynthesis